MTFADRAGDLAGTMPALFGWTAEEFWNATPAELLSILTAVVPLNDAVADTNILTALMEQFPDG